MDCEGGGGGGDGAVSEFSRHLAASGNDDGVSERVSERASEQARIGAISQRRSVAQRRPWPGVGLSLLSEVSYVLAAQRRRRRRRRRRRWRLLFLTRVVRQARREERRRNVERYEPPARSRRGVGGAVLKERGSARGRGTERERETASGSAGTRCSEKWRRRFAW